MVDLQYFRNVNEARKFYNLINNDLKLLKSRTNMYRDSKGTILMEITNLLDRQLSFR